MQCCFLKKILKLFKKKNNKLANKFIFCDQKVVGSKRWKDNQKLCFQKLCYLFQWL